MNIATRSALGAVSMERLRQEQIGAAKRAAGEDWRTCADPSLSDLERYPVLAEEFGEVAKELCEAMAEGRAPGPNLRTELVQVAAVAVAWVEALDAEMESAPAAA